MFTANPEVLVAKGNNMIESSNEFRENSEKVFQTVSDLINNGYLSPAAIQIAKEIESHRQTLEDMAKTIEDYGAFCINSGNKITKNENDIISEI